MDRVKEIYGNHPCPCWSHTEGGGFTALNAFAAVQSQPGLSTELFEELKRKGGGAVALAEEDWLLFRQGEEWILQKCPRTNSSEQDFTERTEQDLLAEKESHVRTREELQHALDRSETLLQEVHHRVKNNLQIISSILNLQSDQVEDDESKEILQESRNRIEAMSFIHESLYCGNDFEKIQLTRYVQGLVSNLAYAYLKEKERIEVTYDIDDVGLALDQAIPCGLIINELVSNAFKYAFPNGMEGELKVGLREKEGRLAIHISDNGIGLPESFVLEHCESLGLQLVCALIEQLDGELEYSKERGTRYLITFDKVKKPQRWR